MQKIIALTWSDLKNILREQILYGMFLIAPVLQFAVLKWGAPALAARYPIIEEYYPGIILFMGLQVVAGIGFVVASILLDERDEDVLTAIRTSPISANTFLAYRLFAVTLIAFLWSLLIISASGLVRFSPLAILGTSFSAGAKCSDCCLVSGRFFQQ
jgi:fluoroquinolone transport system permease protein